MVALVFTLLLVSSALASPVPQLSSDALKLPSFDPRGLLCRLPVVGSMLCPRQGSSNLNVNTPIGTATGTNDASGASRFAVKYGSASRWGASSVATTWELPNGSTDVTALPLACPQPNVADSSFSEDCLSVILYVPKSLSAQSGVPTLMWIHGGSFIVGSATDPGLDGSNLAIATNSIVAVVQYRLGALGWMAPDGSTNLALKDLVTAMQFLQKVVPSFGGEASKITIAGQSSGANMIRALLAAPSASSLFQSAIIQSDPMDYGFLSSKVQTELQSSFTSSLNCSSSDTTCLNALSLDSILGAQTTLFDNAVYIDPSAGQGEPIRPVHDGSFITTTLDSSSPFPHQSKPLLISTVLDEAAPTIYGQFSSALAEDMFTPIVNATFGSPRTQQIIQSPLYAVPTTAGNSTSTVDARAQLQTLGTDYIWKCSSWTFARNWVGNGGQAYVGMYVVGATYPGNNDIPFCMESGSVCHEDDIEIVFGTVPSPSSTQSALTTEMQARYSAFLRTGNPNPTSSSYANWSPATTLDVHAIQLGAAGEAPVGACEPSIWGEAIQYDYQVFDI